MESLYPEGKEAPKAWFAESAPEVAQTKVNELFLPEGPLPLLVVQRCVGPQRRRCRDGVPRPHRLLGRRLPQDVGAAAVDERIQHVGLRDAAERHVVEIDLRVRP